MLTIERWHNILILIMTIQRWRKVRILILTIQRWRKIRILILTIKICWELWYSPWLPVDYPAGSEELPRCSGSLEEHPLLLSPSEFSWLSHRQTKRPVRNQHNIRKLAKQYHKQHCSYISMRSEINTTSSSWPGHTTDMIVEL